MLLRHPTDSGDVDAGIGKSGEIRLWEILTGPTNGCD
jgi:hypothetical protein